MGKKWQAPPAAFLQTKGVLGFEHYEISKKIPSLLRFETLTKMMADLNTQKIQFLWERYGTS